MPSLQSSDGTDIDVHFELDGERLVAVFDWVVGESYVLEFDSQGLGARSVVVRLPDRAEPPEASEQVDGRATLFWRDPTTDAWSIAPANTATRLSTIGQTRVHELQGGWGERTLRLEFTPGNIDRCIEVTAARR